MKKFAALFLTFTLCLSFAACGQASSGSGEAKDYTQAIVAARSDEDNEMEILAAKSGEDAVYSSNPNGLDNADAPQMAEMVLATLGISADQLEEYAFSISLINVRAYAVGVFKPAEGQEDAVKAALEDYLVNIRKSFEQYLADQYEVAKKGKVEVLPSGELLLVMCKDSGDVMSTLKAELK